MAPPRGPATTSNLLDLHLFLFSEHKVFLHLDLFLIVNKNYGPPGGTLVEHRGPVF